MNEIDALKIKLKRPFPLKGIERKIYAANILLLTSGIALSISLEDWQYFAGSGSLVVIVGILVAWKDFAGRIGWFENVAQQTIENELVKTKPSGLINFVENSAVEKELNEYSKSLKEMFVLLRYRLRTIEATTLIVGTAISGFGNVIGNLIHKFHA